MLTDVEKHINQKIRQVLLSGMITVAYRPRGSQRLGDVSLTDAAVSLQVCLIAADAVRLNARLVMYAIVCLCASSLLNYNQTLSWSVVSQKDFLLAPANGGGITNSCDVTMLDINHVVVPLSRGL